MHFKVFFNLLINLLIKANLVPDGRCTEWGYFWGLLKLQIFFWSMPDIPDFFFFFFFDFFLKSRCWGARGVVN